MVPMPDPFLCSSFLSGSIYIYIYKDPALRSYDSTCAHNDCACLRSVFSLRDSNSSLLAYSKKIKKNILDDFFRCREINKYCRELSEHFYTFFRFEQKCNFLRMS